MLALINVYLGWVHAHPREFLGALLLVGWLFNWLFGSVDAAVRGTFSFQEWPRILRSQLASTEALAVYGIYGIGFVGLLAQTAGSVYAVGRLDLVTVTFVVDQLLNLASAAAGLYAIAIWHEVLSKQLPDIASAGRARWFGGPKPVKRNIPKPAAPAPVVVAKT